MPSRTRAGLSRDELGREMSLHALVLAGKKRAHLKMLRFAQALTEAEWAHSAARRPAALLIEAARAHPVARWPAALPIEAGRERRMEFLEKWTCCSRLHCLNQS